MNVVDELARLGIALNAEQAAAWKGIKVPVGSNPEAPAGPKPNPPKNPPPAYNWPRAETGE